MLWGVLFIIHMACEVPTSCFELCCGVCPLQMSTAMDCLISVNTELSQHPVYNVICLGWFPGVRLRDATGGHLYASSAGGASEDTLCL